MRGRAREKKQDEGERAGEDGNGTRVTNEKEWLRKIGGQERIVVTKQSYTATKLVADSARKLLYLCEI